ncbi:hypothetical protein ACTU45_03725 [Streptomyces sp. 24-1644]|uniref:hypothetical protein n=1 Tax=Streptomyces sp. 24-1644 TaxID=3457315 RepID=UPI003FA6843A
MDHTDVTNVESALFSRHPGAVDPDALPFSTHVLNGDGPPEARIEAWCGDVRGGEVRR